MRFTPKLLQSILKRRFPWKKQASGIWVQPFFSVLVFILLTFFSGSVFAAGVDQYTTLLVQSDTTDMDTTFVDSSSPASPHTIIPTGDVHHSTDLPLPGFGATTIYFDGDGGELAIADHPDWHFGIEPFTIDFWINPSRYHNVFENYIQFGNYGTFHLEHSRSGLRGGMFEVRINGVIHTSGYRPDHLGTWKHIAVVRSGSGVKLFVDGTLSDTFSIPANTDIVPTSVTGEIGIGLDDAHNFPYQGYMAEIRISKGVARWWSDNFTPPDAPYGDDSITPIAVSNVAATPVSGQAPLDVNFSAPVIGGTAPYTYAWDFGDSDTGTDQNPSHTYTAPGAYAAQVTVTDADGNTATGSAH